MKFFFPFAICSSLMIVLIDHVKAQPMKDSIERGTVYTISGIGLGITGGKTKEVISPKVSTKIGVDVTLGKKGLFIYPSVNFLVFNYSQKVGIPNYPYNIESGGRTAITSFTIPLGWKFNIYEYAGPGVALILEPRSEVDVQSQQIKLTDQDKYSVSFTGGLGAEYLLGQFALFIEASHLYNLKEFQDRKTFIFPVFVGFKSNISNVFKSKKMQ
jgi:hypothetical protein